MSLYYRAEAYARSAGRRKGSVGWWEMVISTYDRLVAEREDRLRLRDA